MADGIPSRIKDELAMSPAEEVTLFILRDRIPDVPTQTLVRDGQDFPFILLRRDPMYGGDGGDPRFTDKARLSIQTFVAGIDGDQGAGDLAHYINRVLFQEARERRTAPGRGTLLSSRMVGSPRRAPDWASSTGPVQYAELPSGVWRYETIFEVTVRHPLPQSSTP